MNNKINMSQVAKDLGMSVSTVSRALAGKGRISDKTRERIFQYLEERDLTPNIIQQNYEERNLKVISVVLPGEEDFASMPYFFDIFLSLYDFFSLRGYQVTLIKITPKDISNLVHAVESHVMDGVVLTRTVENNDEVMYLKKMGVPFVVIGPYDDPSVLSVDTDNENACCDITNMLFKKGCRKLAVMCANRGHYINKKRMNGILRAYMESHMCIDWEYVFYDTEMPNVAEMALEKAVAGGCDCILCMDDNICLTVLRMMRKLEIDVPGDMRIAALHNSSLLDEWYPPISCLHFDVDELGKEAGRILYTYLTEHKRLPKSILGYYELQMKASTS